MSFSSKVKEEVSKISNLANKEIVKYELLGYFATNHTTIEKNKIKFTTENEYNINRFSKLLNNLQHNNYEIQINGKIFCIILPKIELEEIMYSESRIELNQKILKSKIQKDEILEKALVRGCFLGAGSINNPENTYHLEIPFTIQKNAQLICDILKKYEIPFKQLSKKNSYSIYTKDGDEISKFLALIGANYSVLQFEQIRVIRDIRNNVNRKVNCETANLSKTVNAAMKQIEAINYLQQLGELEKMPEPLQELAKLRLENPEASLIELGQLLKNPIGKSGVNHRFETILKIAEKKGLNK